MAGQAEKTKNGYDKFQVVSALQKCIRRGVEYDAAYWAMELAHSGYSTWLWDRLQIIACEDIGPANPGAISVVTACRDIWERTAKRIGDKSKFPEGNILCHTILHLCRSAKSREADALSNVLTSKRLGRDPVTRQPDGRSIQLLPIPQEAIDGHTQAGKAEYKRRAKAEKTTPEAIFTIDFREDKSRVNNPSRTFGQDGVNWVEEICKLEGTDASKAFEPATTVTPYTPKSDTLQARPYRMIGEGIYEMDAAAKGTEPYAINMKDGTCTCEAYKRNKTCKHLAFLRADLNK
jgi:hypothetical protein